MKTNDIKSKIVLSISSIVLVFTTILIISISLNSCKDEDKIVDSSVTDDKTLLVMVRDSCDTEIPINKAKVYLAPGKNVIGPLNEEFFIGETNSSGNFEYNMKGKCSGAIYTLEIEGAEGTILEGVRRRVDSLFLTCCDDKVLLVFPITKITINVSDDCDNLLNGAKVYLQQGLNHQKPLPEEFYVGQTNSKGILTFDKYLEKDSMYYTIEIRGPENSQHKDSIIYKGDLLLFNCYNNLYFKFKCVESMFCTSTDISRNLSFKYCVDTNRVHKYFSQEFENSTLLNLIVRFESLSNPFPNNNPRIACSIVVGNTVRSFNQDIPIAPGEKYRFGIEMESDNDAIYQSNLNYNVIRADNNSICYSLKLNLNLSAEKCSDCKCPSGTEFNYPANYPEPDTTCITPDTKVIQLNIFNDSQKNCDWIYSIKKDFNNKSAFTLTKMNNRNFVNSFTLKQGELLSNLEIEFRGNAKGFYKDSIVFAIHKKDNFSTTECPETVVVRLNIYKDEGDNCTDCRCPNHIELNYPPYDPKDTLKKSFPSPEFTCDNKTVTFDLNMKNQFKDDCDWIFKVEKDFTNNDAYKLESFNGKAISNQYVLTKNQTLSNIKIRFSPSNPGNYIDTIIFSVQKKDKFQKITDCAGKIILRLSMQKGWAECNVNLPNNMTFPKSGSVCYARTSYEEIFFTNNGNCDLNCNINASITGQDATYFILDKTSINGIPKNTNASFKITFAPTYKAIFSQNPNKTTFNATLNISSSCSSCPTKSITLTGNANDDEVFCGTCTNGDPNINDSTTAIKFNCDDNFWTTSPNTADFDLIATNVDVLNKTCELTTQSNGKLMYIGNAIRIPGNPCEYWKVTNPTFDNACENNTGTETINAKQGDFIILSSPNLDCCVVLWIDKIDENNTQVPVNYVILKVCFINQ